MNNECKEWKKKRFDFQAEMRERFFFLPKSSNPLTASIAYHQIIKHVGKLKEKKKRIPAPHDVNGELYSIDW